MRDVANTTVAGGKATTHSTEEASALVNNVAIFAKRMLYKKKNFL